MLRQDGQPPVFCVDGNIFYSGYFDMVLSYHSLSATLKHVIAEGWGMMA